MEQHSQEENEEAVEYYLNLCLDVLFELLRFGNRRQLTKLERIGRRVHCLNERYFHATPFIRLNLRLQAKFVLISFLFF